MEFSILLKRLRTIKKLKQSDLSRHLGTTQTYISNLENPNSDTKPPTYEKVKKIEECLNITTKEEQYKFYLSAYTERASEDDQKYLNKINKLADEIGRDRIFALTASGEVPEEIKEHIIEKFSPVLGDMTEVLTDPMVLESLALLHELPQNKRNEVLRMFTTIAKGAMAED